MFRHGVISRMGIARTDTTVGGKRLRMFSSNRVVMERVEHLAKRMKEGERAWGFSEEMVVRFVDVEMDEGCSDK